MSNNQNILQNFDWLEELDEQAAETITGVGGSSEKFTIRNKTKDAIKYTLDGRSFTQKSNEGFIWTTTLGGIIKFDSDTREKTVSNKSYDLSDGKKYEFRDNTKTTDNKFDIELFDIG
jgi:hypothetical protein